MHHPRRNGGYRMEDQPNFFEAGSPFLQHPLLTAERTAGEVDFLLSELKLAAGARILDVGCGFGRHSVALAQRGYAVTGIDPAAAMIAAARERAEAAAVSVDFQQLPAEQLVAEAAFDAAICLFTTLGQISATGENSALVQRVYAALKPGGQFMVEVPQRQTAVRQMKPSDKFGEGDRYTAVSRRYDPDDRTATEIFTLVAPENTRTYLLRYRLFDRDELTALLAQAGFTVGATYGDYAGAPLADDSAMMLMVGRK